MTNEEFCKAHIGSLGMTRQCVGLTLTGGRNTLMAERIP